MRQPIPAAGNPGGKARWTDTRDWMAEFPAESPSNPGLLAGATTLPILTRAAPRSGTTRRRRTRTHRSILLTMSAMALMFSASTAVVLWMRVVLAPVPLAEWPAAPPPLFSQPSAVPNPRLASALEVPPTPEPPSQPAAASAPPAAVQSTRAVTAPPAASGASDESAILSVLDRYRLTFSSANPGSVRAAAFDNCRIDVLGAQAEAICAGRVSLVTRAGSQERNIQPRRWTFTLARQADTWKIKTVDSQ